MIFLVDKLANQFIIIRCPKCKFFQAIESIMYGREIKNRLCFRCEHKIPISMNTHSTYDYSDHARTLHIVSELNEKAMENM